MIYQQYINFPDQGIAGINPVCEALINYLISFTFDHLLLVILRGLMQYDIFLFDHNASQLMPKAGIRWN